MLRVIGMVVVACILSILGYTGLFYVTTPSAKAVLQRVGHRYATAQDYAAKSKMTVAMNMMGMDMTQTVTSTTRAKKPLKMRVTMESDALMGGYSVVCDGKQAYVRMAAMGKAWIKEPMPKNLEGLEQYNQYSAMGDGVNVYTLLEGGDPLKDVTQATLDRGAPWKPRKPLVVSLVFKDKGTQRLWINRQDYLIRRSEWHPSMDLGGMLDEAQKRAGDSGAPKDSEPMLKGYAEQMKGMKYTLTEEFQDVGVDLGLQDQEFAFKLGPGEKVISQDEMMAELRKQMGEMGGGTEAAELTGKPAPDFTVTDVEGKTLKLSSLRGKPVLLDFCASWCGPCRMELPHVQELYQEYHAKGLEVIGLSSDATEADLTKWLKEEKVTFRAAWLDPSNSASRKISEAYNVTGIPRVLVIDAQGTIRADLTGYHEKSALAEALKKAGL